jgi:hypothetical protein
MTADTTAADSTAAESTATPAAPSRITGLWLRTSPPLPPSWPWRRGALLLAAAAQLITISWIVGVDPPALTWSVLLLAIAPAPLLVPAAFAPQPVSRLAAASGVVVLVVGLIGQITHIGLFFLPALAVLFVGTLMLWREPA